MLNIVMPRGDIRLIRFQVIDFQTGERSQVDFDEIYMTVKKSIYERNYIFQKRLSDGDIVKLDAGDYQIRLEASDTDQLDFNKVYPFDIELIYEDEIKQTVPAQTNNQSQDIFKTIPVQLNDNLINN